MASDQTNDTGTSEPENGGSTIVAIPEDQAEAVLEFVEKLKQGDEVSGHMISSTTLGGFGGGPLMARGTLSNCQVTGSKQMPDKSCYDTDKW